MADYHEDTALLIDQMCEVVERESFKLDKDKAQESILQTYDLFGLPRPKNIVWCDSPFDETFERSARSAGSAGSAWAAWAARSAWAAWAARSARSAGSARSAWAAWAARSARSAGSAGSAWAARSARSAWAAGWTALDEDFWHFVFSYEYVRNPDQNLLPNEHDHNYIKYSELLFEAIKHGAGYRVEWEDTLYIAPTPLVLIDANNQFHADSKPAIKWSNHKFYYLHGVNFEKKTWQRIVDQKMTLEEIAKGNLSAEQNAIAIQFLRPDLLLKQVGAELINTGIKGTELYEVKNFMETGDTEYCMKMEHPSIKDKLYIEWVHPDIGKKKDADLAQATAFGMAKEDYLMAMEA